MLRNTVVLSWIPTQDNGNLNPKKISNPEFGSQPRRSVRYFKNLYKFGIGKVKPLLI